MSRIEFISATLREAVEETLATGDAFKMNEALKCVNDLDEIFSAYIDALNTVDRIAKHPSKYDNKGPFGWIGEAHRLSVRLSEQVVPINSDKGIDIEE